MNYKKVNIIAYLCRPGEGSEFGVGYQSTNYLGTLRGRLITPKFEFDCFKKVERKINNITFKKIRKSLILIKLANNEKPKTTIGYRFGYIIWVIKCRFLLRNLKGLFWFVTLAQIITPIPFLFFKKNYLLGPLGGQQKLWKYRYLSFGLRLKNYILNKILYPINSFFLNNKKILISHPLIEIKKINTRNIISNLTQFSKKKSFFFHKKKNIVFIGRKIEIKNPKIIKLLFTKLSNLFPAYHFKIIGLGWKYQIINKNFKILPHLQQNQIHEILKESRLHVFLSFELGGTVLFEAVRFGCPNFTLKNSGSEYLVAPSNYFLLNPNVDSADVLVANAVKKISKFIKDDNILKKEFLFQYKHSLKFTIESKFKKINSLLVNGKY
jgi:glycosyltransferase involved in cell wall biosynthesis